MLSSRAAAPQLTVKWAAIHSRRRSFSVVGFQITPSRGLRRQWNWFSCGYFPFLTCVCCLPQNWKFCLVPIGFVCEKGSPIWWNQEVKSPPKKKTARHFCVFWLLFFFRCGLMDGFVVVESKWTRILVLFFIFTLGVVCGLCEHPWSLRLFFFVFSSSSSSFWIVHLPSHVPLLVSTASKNETFPPFLFSF